MPMNVIVHKATDDESERNTEKLIANLHASIIREYLNKLQCSKSKKIEILTRIEKEL
jgi:hypothetical protein